MKPQPPVTKMRIVPRTSSGLKGARADFSAGLPDAAQAILNALESNWMFWLILALAVLALALTAINMFGGFAVTRRMLAMFRK